MNIIQNRKKYYLLSIVVILIGLLAMPFYAFKGQGILNYDVEFTGGAVMQIDMGQEVNPSEDIIPLLDEYIPDNGARIQKVRNSNQIIITMRPVGEDQRTAFYKALSEQYDLTQEDLLKNDFVSPTISGEFKQKATLAIVIGAVLMLLYITIRFKNYKFGASAVMALVHNVLIVLGVYALFRIPVNNSFIAAMLTIIGYSINDTIVIFDRIRENKGRMQRDDEIIINESIKQSLTRSINTSLTTLVMVLLIVFLGTDSVRQFALPIAVGIVAGTYSSIFIASPLWYDFCRLAKTKK